MSTGLLTFGFLLRLVSRGIIVGGGEMSGGRQQDSASLALTRRYGRRSIWLTLIVVGGNAPTLEGNAPD